MLSLLHFQFKMKTVTPISVVLRFSSNKLQVVRLEMLWRQLCIGCRPVCFADTVTKVLSDVVHYNICYFTIKYCNNYKVYLVANNLCPKDEKEVQFLTIKNKYGNNSGLPYLLLSWLNKTKKILWQKMYGSHITYKNIKLRT